MRDRGSSPAAITTYVAARVPINAFGMVLGLVGLGLLWRQAEDVFLLPVPASQVILSIGTLTFVGLAAMYVVKATRHVSSVRDEFRHPVSQPFFAAAPMSLFLLALAAEPVVPWLARSLWMIGAAGQLGVAVLLVGRWITGKFRIEDVHPGWFLPVFGGLLAPISGAHIGYPEISWLFFTIGVGVGAPMFVIVLRRLGFNDPMPSPLTPTLVILVAPPALMFLGWLQLNGGTLDGFARTTFYLGVVFTLILLRFVPRFLRLQFAMSWWAYTFPLDAMATASLVYFDMLRSHASATLAVFYLTVATSVVVLVFVRTIYAALTR